MTAMATDHLDSAGTGQPTDQRPLVVACVRIADQRPRVDPLTGAVERDQWGVGLSAADAAAVEHALRVADTWSGRVVVVTAAGRPADPVLRDLASLGATVVRVALEDDDAGALAGDERTLADALVEALAPFGRPELVVCGDRSGDRGTGALPAFLAHRWGAAQALGLVGLEAADGHVVAERRLDGGWRERLTVPCPAVCSVEAAGVRLRRASLPSTLRSSAAGIPEKSPTVDLTVQSVGVGALVPFRPRTRVVPGPDGPDPRLRLLALTGVLAEHDPPTVVGPVDAVGAADALFDFFRRHGYPTGAEADHR